MASRKERHYRPGHWHPQYWFWSEQVYQFSWNTPLFPQPFWSSFSREFLTHQILGASNVWGVENLARLNAESVGAFKLPNQDRPAASHWFWSTRPGSQARGRQRRTSQVENDFTAPELSCFSMQGCGFVGQWCWRCDYEQWLCWDFNLLLYFCDPLLCLLFLTQFCSHLQLRAEKRIEYMHIYICGLWGDCVTILWIDRLQLKSVSCSGGGNILADSCDNNPRRHNLLVRSYFGEDFAFHCWKWEGKEGRSPRQMQTGWNMVGLRRKASWRWQSKPA